MLLHHLHIRPVAKVFVPYCNPLSSRRTPTRARNFSKQAAGPSSSAIKLLALNVAKAKIRRSIKIKRPATLTALGACCLPIHRLEILFSAAKYYCANSIT